ncbi:hypothetical protein COBT_002370 [Conglomerata obtusa]
MILAPDTCAIDNKDKNIHDTTSASPNRKRVSSANENVKQSKHPKAGPINSSNIADSNEFLNSIDTQKPILNLKIIRTSDDGTLDPDSFGICCKIMSNNFNFIYLQNIDNFENYPIYMKISTNLDNFKSIALEKMNTFYKLVQSDLNNLINYRMSQRSSSNHNSNINPNPTGNSPNYRCGINACFFSSYISVGLCENCLQNCMLLCFLDFNYSEKKFTMKEKYLWVAFLNENLLKNLWFLCENSETIGVSKLNREFSYVYFDNICESIKKSDVRKFRFFALLLCIIDLENCENYINHNNIDLKNLLSEELSERNEISLDKRHSVLCKINDLSTTFDNILSVLYFSKTVEFNYIYVLKSIKCSNKILEHVIQVKNNILFLNKIFEINEMKQVKLSAECFFYWTKKDNSNSVLNSLNDLIKVYHKSLEYHARIQKFLKFLNSALNTNIEMSDICNPCLDRTTRKEINGIIT